jgi:hypothetical protein
MHRNYPQIISDQGWNAIAVVLWLLWSGVWEQIFWEVLTEVLNDIVIRMLTSHLQAELEEPLPSRVPHSWGYQQNVSGPSGFSSKLLYCPGVPKYAIPSLVASQKLHTATLPHSVSGR